MICKSSDLIMVYGAQKNGVRGINEERENRSKVQILINQQHREGEV